ncbi:hypothetical protein HC248_01456 [Polaromonas vacuolata]|uniref:Uncharacterized protein n=1 Tax=Polaromonas vacuolata TaxID=37448 RepID=A0A6H2H8L8_9BURK|nr:hypothetical protein [Polaromonas vacuolata]QJC56170.1 hypothetical protein HC248_01456 [Polaromonas vacuolata]
MQVARKITVMLLIAAAIACAWLAPMDGPAKSQVDAGLKRALVSFATARALNAVISVAQGTEASIQPLGVGVTLTPGQVLEPVNNLVEQFSNLMLVASVIFGIQKVLISIGSYWPLSALVTLAALTWAWCYLCQSHPPALLSRLLLILLMLRFAVPVVTIGTDMLWQKYLAADYAVSQNSISTTSGQADQLNPVAQSTASSQSLVEKMKGWFDKNADVSVHFQNLKAAAEQAVEHIIKLIVIFVLQTLVIPLLMFWCLYGVIKRTVEWPSLTK